MKDPKTVEEIKKLRLVMTDQEVADRFGVSRTTIYRWINPEYNRKVLEAGLRAKRRRRGICERCGGETKYNGHTVNGPSRICTTCAHTFTHCAKGHAYTAETRLDSSTQGHSCRICRNEYAREYSARKRRDAGVPQRDPSLYDSRRLKWESEGAATK